MNEEITPNNDNEIDYSRFDDMFDGFTEEEMSVMSKEDEAAARAAKKPVVSEKEIVGSTEMVFGAYNIADDEDDEEIVVGWHAVPVQTPEDARIAEDIEVEVEHTDTFRVGGVQFKTYGQRHISLWGDGGEFDDWCIRELPEFENITDDTKVKIKITADDLKQARDYLAMLAE